MNIENKMGTVGEGCDAKSKIGEGDRKVQNK